MKTISMELSEYQTELARAEQNGERKMRRIINEAKKYGLNEFESEDLESALDKARDAENKRHLRYLFSKGEI